MQFQLPDNLAAKVAEYDPALKAIARLTKAGQTDGAPKAPRMTLGVPTDLFPVEFLTEKEQREWAVEINQRVDNERAVIINNNKATGLLVHTESRWIALWFWSEEYKTRHSSEYLYGVTIAHRNTDAVLQRIGSYQYCLGYCSGDNVYLDQYCTPTEVTYGRVKMIRRSLNVTVEMISKGIKQIPAGPLLDKYGRKNYHKRTAYQNWRSEFKTGLSSWADEPGLFNRIAEQGDVRKAVWGIKEMPDTTSFVDLLLEKYSRNERLIKVLGTPFFKKEANEVFNQTITIYLDPETTERKQVSRPTRCFQHRIERLAEFLDTYPDATLDHCQQLYSVAINVNSLPRASTGVTEWLRQNMPIASYLMIINKEVEKYLQESSGRYCSYHTGHPETGLRTYCDTIQMLEQLHRYQNNKGNDRYGCLVDAKPLELVKPNRWRLTEFHDYVAAECFKISTPNEKLCQDLFPEPIRVEIDGTKWSFFQPHDVHQLASWGRAVRNCVGSADSYRKGIKAKTHFIVLAMIDNKPRFTIQLKYRHPHLTVDQIADISNRRLNDQERSKYEQAFSEALKLAGQQQSSEVE